MDAFIIFSLVCFVLYLQAGVYALWRNANDGITHWFLIHILLYAIWSLSFVFSGMGPAAQELFDPKILLVTGLLLTPAFFVRILVGLMHKPASQLIRNSMFFALFFSGLSILLYLILSGKLFMPERFSAFDDIWLVFSILAIFFALNVFMVILLRARVLRPSAWSHDIIHGLRQILIICDRNLTVNYANQYTLEVLEKSMGDITGKPIGDLFSESSDISQQAVLAMKNNSHGPITCMLEKSGPAQIPVRIEIIKLVDTYQDVHGMAIIGEDMQKMMSLHDLIVSYEKDISELNSATNELELLVREFSVRLAKLNDALNEQYKKAQLVEEQVLEDHTEKEWLTYEIHNRVIDNLVLIASIVKLHDQRYTAGHARKKLDVLSGRIHALLLIHKFLYFSMSYSAVDFKEFVYQLVREKFETYELEGKLAVRLHLSEFFLEIERAIPLGLILNELLINAIIHAFGPIAIFPNDPEAFIMIEYVERADDILFVFEDNGTGIPATYSPDDFRSNGLVLIDVLVKDQLGGKIHIDSSAGTKVLITIPKDALMQGR